jgi:hypothetical protein
MPSKIIPESPVLSFRAKREILVVQSIKRPLSSFGVIHYDFLRLNQRIIFRFNVLRAPSVFLKVAGSFVAPFAAKYPDPGRYHNYFGRKSNPTRIRSVADMSPMNFLKGRGSFFMSVGTATIWSPFARAGCW